MMASHPAGAAAHDAAPAFDFVLFGATGDLARRKLLPALFDAHAAGSLHPAGRILALGSQPLTHQAYLDMLQDEVLPALAGDAAAAAWPAFLERILYLQVDANAAAGFDALAELVNARAAPVVVFYLATAPHLFVTVCGQLARVGLTGPRSRIVLEKPLGHDLASSESINAEVARHFAEDQIYRIDHYLGKESVQNLMAVRFGNVLFEPLWRREWVRQVQITIAEELGVERRGNFYDGIGALRDMVQNHLLQLLCMVAMEPPASLSEDAIRDEKLKILKALRPIRPEDVAETVVRGQYARGAVGGDPVPGYASEPGIAPDSRTETFVAIRAEIANWRWAGVPFYLRTGKRMQARVAEIVIHFHDVPHPLFPHPPGVFSGNRLVITLQPQESIRLYFLTKQPGDTQALTPASLDLQLTSAAPRVRRVGAYERLLLDVIRGRLGLFVRRDEQVQAWRWVAPILKTWETSPTPPKPYTAGTWGPAASSALLSRDGMAWHEEM
ncbi:glucose-6-phosphate dehydrogenase [Cupriavidus neocaledonicus]|uniref:Glucose-6-phosphate 1-dehydrogenase n=1 Tax=Cupriavidus neocaledonicus TaxID=1040979 RepID=A0A375HST3_9BURK|nr:glucose-6-phosphate dehydrogenase [Cupriavidus neocaledonicus]SOZ38547.1 Glucose-6-phosphate 1-dehydrogenase [Cupriavidus neocaledonicus]SPD59807.1 Glucose-6-phosphate 1-dehydrogenase [Cupriavidus neocaledonicus]